VKRVPFKLRQSHPMREFSKDFSAGLRKISRLPRSWDWTAVILDVIGNHFVPAGVQESSIPA
jgi:hypothetical protein